MTAQQVANHTQDAVLAYATLDEEGFYASANTATERLPCVGDVLLPSHAAAFHRLIGLRAMYEGDKDRAALSFQAAAAIEPDHVLSARIAPEGGKVDRAYQDARRRAPSLQVPFAPPRGHEGYVDGAAATTRPANIPAIVQVAARGQAAWTAYVAAGERLPDELPSGGPAAAAPPVVEPVAAPIAAPVAPAPTPKPLPTAPPPTADRSSAGGMWAGAIVTGVLSVALAGGSVYSRTRFDRDPTALNYHATNGGYYGAIGMGVMTVGLIGGAAAMGGE